MLRGGLPPLIAATLTMHQRQSPHVLLAALGSLVNLCTVDGGVHTYAVLDCLEANLLPLIQDSMVVFRVCRPPFTVWTCKVGAGTCIWQGKQGLSDACCSLHSLGLLSVLYRLDSCMLSCAQLAKALDSWTFPKYSSQGIVSALTCHAKPCVHAEYVF